MFLDSRSFEIGCGILLISGRAPEEPSGSLTEVITMRVSAEFAAHFLRQFAGRKTYPRTHHDLRLRFMEKLAFHPSPKLREIAAGETELSIDAVRRLAADTNFDVLAELSKNEAVLQLPVAELLSFCRKSDDIIQEVAARYFFAVEFDEPAPPSADVDAFIEAFIEHSDPAIREAVIRLAEVVLERDNNPTLIEKRKAMEATRRINRLAFITSTSFREGMPSGRQRRWLDERIAQVIGNESLAENQFGRPGEYVYAFAFEADNAGASPSESSRRFDQNAPLLFIPYLPLDNVAIHLPDLPAATPFIERLASHPCHHVRENIAGRFPLPEHLVKQLASDPALNVREALMNARRLSEMEMRMRGSYISED